MQDNDAFTAARGEHVWEKMGLIWSAIFLTAAGIPLTISLLDPRFSGGEKGLILVLGGGIILWHLGAQLWFRRVPDFRERPPLTLTYIAGLIAFWFALVSIFDSFHFVLAGIFSQIFWMLPISWAAAASTVLTLLMVYDQVIVPGPPYSWLEALIYVAINIFGIGVAFWLSLIIRQSHERQALIEELETTQSNLVSAERRAGILEERQRLAHEIHDTLAQGFISIVMHLETAEQEMNGAGETAVHHHLRQAKETARENLQEARRVVAALRPEPLQELPLPQALARTVERWSAAQQIPATFKTTGTAQPLHPDIDVTLLRATQEGLANVQKHARATAVAVTLSYMADLLLLDVQDDGVGMGDGGRDDRFGGGYGLQAMRERVTALHGEVLLESEPDEGTTLVVTIPIGERQELAEKQGENR